MMDSKFIKELGLPLYVLDYAALIKSFLGETLSNIQKFFDAVHGQRGIFLIDEIDSLLLERSRTDDVAEMKRAVTMTLVNIEKVTVDGFLIGCSNHKDILDRAMFRRFDCIVRFDLPTELERKWFMEYLFEKYHIPVMDRRDYETVRGHVLRQKSMSEIERFLVALFREWVLNGDDFVPISNFISDVDDYLS